ncbi:MAG: hypothetical protein KGJ23_13820 [Euryarchaeota archaeon]|nr:hypothetical protein [Euryarchaeota archaeon]MDE1880350.1 hypothetical protein [Euryarchaeota archaeon]MDE2046341.1 hypothetical protein [Thermoplasmata archaeon]
MHALSFLVIILLLVTCVGYTVYVAEGLSGSQVVFSYVVKGYNTTLNTTEPNGSISTSTQHVGPSGNGTSPVGPVSLPPYSAFVQGSSIADLMFVWGVLAFSAMSILKPANRRDPSKLPDILYLNLLFGVVFWPLAALGAWLGTAAPSVMLLLGLLPAIVITMFIARFVEEGSGGPIFLILVLAAMGAVMGLNGVLWSAVLSGPALIGVVAVEVLLPVVYLFMAAMDKAEPIRSRPLVAELLLWGGIGIILSTLVGVAAAGSFGGGSLPVLATTSLFTGSTVLLAPNMEPWSFIHGLAPNAFGQLVATVFPWLFGLLGVLTAVMTLPPLMATRDFLMVKSGLSVADTCHRCKRPYFVLKSQYSGYCGRCRVLPQVLRSLPSAGQAGSPTRPPVPPMPPPPSAG